MGCYIGQVRAYEGVPLEQLAQGLCTKSYLCRVENGEREAGKLLTDALLQRLGKPVELFDRILDWDEYQQWLRRQRIWRHLSAGEVSLATAAMQAYQAADVLEHQFLQTAKLNLRALQGAAVEELRDLALAALLLTQPSLIDHGEPQLLSQNEGWLLLTYLELWEQLDGLEAVSGDYQKLLQLLCQRRYDARERVYLFPYVACHVIEVEFRQGHLAEALAICERALRELSQEKRLYAYGRLLEWKQRAVYRPGADRTGAAAIAVLAERVASPRSGPGEATGSLYGTGKRLLPEPGDPGAAEAAGIISGGCRRWYL